MSAPLKYCPKCGSANLWLRVILKHALGTQQTERGIMGEMQADDGYSSTYEAWEAVCEDCGHKFTPRGLTETMVNDAMASEE